MLEANSDMTASLPWKCPHLTAGCRLAPKSQAWELLAPVLHGRGRLRMPILYPSLQSVTPVSCTAGKPGDAVPKRMLQVNSARAPWRMEAAHHEMGLRSTSIR